MNELPVIAIVGRPNVGKSTLFNQMCRTRAALVADEPGVTRDRHYGLCHDKSSSFIVIDTGGIAETDFEIDTPMLQQVEHAITESDCVLFVVDARAGVTAADISVTNKLRVLSKPVIVVVNKTDGLDQDVSIADFYQLGFDSEPSAIAASHGRGIATLLQAVSKQLPEQQPSTTDIDNTDKKPINVAIVGKPNVGKSTLVNRFLGEDRMVVFDQAGTTRDSISSMIEKNGRQYCLIDTAGIRRRSKIAEKIEKFSVIKALQSIERANVVLLVINAVDNITDQDLSLLGFVVETGRSLVIAINKWDGLDIRHKQLVKDELEQRLCFVDFAKIHYISALHGTGVGDLWSLIDAAYDSANVSLKTSELTDTLLLAVQQNPPPMVRSRRVKLRYANPGGHNPPTVVIHGNQTEQLPKHYKRYLNNYYSKALKLVGTPLRLVFKTSDNPFKGQRNKLTPRQEYKRKRAKRLFKK